MATKVWATLLTNSSYLAGLLVVHRTLQALSAYPLVVMATDALPPASRDIIREAGMTIVDVDHITPAAGQHAGFDPAFVRLNDAWTKLRVFGLSQYERVVLIDSDMLFLRGMDEVFDMKLPGSDWIGAAPACVCNPLQIAHYPKDWIPANCSLSLQTTTSGLYDPPIPDPHGPRTSHLLNSGMVVLQPSSNLMEKLLDFLHTSPSVAASQFADQDVIAEAFHGRWRPMPWWTNALKPERAVHPDLWRDTEVRLIHYILDKPWNKRPDLKIHPVSGQGLPVDLIKMAQSTGPQQSLTNYDEVHAWWWMVYDDLLRDMQTRGDSSGWREVDGTVRR